MDKKKLALGLALGVMLSINNMSAVQAGGDDGAGETQAAVVTTPEVQASATVQVQVPAPASVQTVDPVAQAIDAAQAEQAIVKTVVEQPAAQPAPVPAAQVPQTPVAVAQPVQQVEVNTDRVVQSYVNWDKGADSEIIAVGIGLPPKGMGPRGNVLARRAAVVDAQRNLVEMIKGVQVDSETLMENLIVTNDVVRTQVSGLVKGARIVKEHLNADGSYQVVMRLPLYGETGSLAAAALPQVPAMAAPAEPAPVVNLQATAVPKQEIKAVQQAGYTGVIVDARGLGLEPTFSPVIFDTNKRAIYGARNITSSFAINMGMVEYAKDLAVAAVKSRAGANPLIIKASGVVGGMNSVNKVNVVVSVDDGDKVLLANERTNILGNCSVVFVR